MLRVVLDANVFISGLLSEYGPPGRILDAWLEQKFFVLVSNQIINEIQRVMDYPRILERLEPSLADQLIENLADFCEITESKLTLDVLVKDPSDNIYLSCAVEARPDYLVTGNPNHYQEAGNPYQGITILTPRIFFRDTPNRFVDKSRESPQSCVRCLGGLFKSGYVDPACGHDPLQLWLIGL